MCYNLLTKVGIVNDILNSKDMSRLCKYMHDEVEVKVKNWDNVEGFCELNVLGDYKYKSFTLYIDFNSTDPKGKLEVLAFPYHYEYPQITKNQNMKEMVYGIRDEVRSKIVHQGKGGLE